MTDYKKLLRMFPVTQNALTFVQLKIIASELSTYIARGYTDIEMIPVFDTSDVDIIIKYEIRGLYYDSEKTVIENIDDIKRRVK